MQTLTYSRITAYLFFASILLSASCSDILNEIDDETTEQKYFGWSHLTVNDDIDDIPHDITFASDEALPTEVSLVEFFPPVGNQEEYGTSVTWALAYYLRTYLEGLKYDYSAAILHNPEFQFSPADLFLALPSQYKYGDCDGTSFKAAFDVMLNRGVATLETAPYSLSGGCNEFPSSLWTAEAADYKIATYRQIALDIDKIKARLAQGEAIAAGAKVGDNFINWNSSSVLSSETYTSDASKNAYQALVLCGYDDSKSAFRLLNSWGKEWGDNGMIWVDYNFFVTEFCKAAFVARLSTDNPDTNNDNEVDNPVNGSDVVAWELEDVDNPNVNDPRFRTVSYNVFNNGNETLMASNDWGIAYAYYNAYDASDYGLLFYDYYSNDYGDYGDYGDFIDVGAAPIAQGGNWYNHFSIEPGNSVAQTVLGYTNARFTIYYELPASLNGDYYLVMLADVFDTVDETDENNNLLLFADNDGAPLSVVNGVIQTENSSIFAQQQSITGRASNSTQTLKNSNTYTAKEIQNFLKKQLSNGGLQSKINMFTQPTATRTDLD